MSWKAKAVACRLLGPDGDHYWPGTEMTCRYCGYTWEQYQDTHSTDECEQELERIGQLDSQQWSGWKMPEDKPLGLMLSKQPDGTWRVDERDKMAV